jgi:hypothetical protein
VKQRVVPVVLMSVLAGIVSCNRLFAPDFDAAIRSSAAVNRLPAVDPDYTGITIPPNIGPMNFTVRDSGTEYFVRLSSDRGPAVVLFSKDARIRIPQKQWSALLSQNAGGRLRIAVYARGRDNLWRAFTAIEDSIAVDKIDPYVMYRTLSVLYNYSRDICIYQRDIRTNRETEVLNALNFFPGCVNCHTLYNHGARKALLHVRTQDYGNSALVIDGSSVTKINTKLGYSTWHPNGRLAVCSINKVNQCFHSTWKDPRDAFDLTSGLVVYDAVKRRIVTVPQIFQEKALETWPCWSPDGRYLYFSSGPIPWTDFKTIPPDGLENVRYSLLRIPYDETKDSWGTIDTVLSAGKTGLSMTQPRISPDGKFLVFCMHRYGPSPYLQRSSDLYLMNLATKSYSRMPVNSDEAESWHGWSSNGRWMVFTSKRIDGVLGRVYFCRVDGTGAASKPFLMPQKDPDFYASFIKSYNVPEFSREPFGVSQADLVAAVKSPGHVDVSMPVTSATPRPPR